MYNILISSKFIMSKQQREYIVKKERVDLNI